MNEQMVLQPQSRDAEQYVLGACIALPEAYPIVGSRLKASHFYDYKHAAIYNAISSLGNDQKPIDLLTVTQLMRDNGTLHDDLIYLTDLIRITVGISSLDYQIDRIINKAALRDLLKASANITELCYQQDIDASDALKQAETAMFNVMKERSGDDESRKLEAIQDASEDFIEYLIKLRDGKISAGMPTGFFYLDRFISFREQALIVVAGRPAMGKSAFMLQIAINAIKTGRSIAIFSLEMSRRDLLGRLFAILADVPGGKISSGNLSDEDMQRIEAAKETLAGAKLFIDDQSYDSVAQVKNKARYLQYAHGLDMVIIDYIQLLGGSNKKGYSNRTEEVSEVTRHLKKTAKELQIPVIALSQLSRAVEARQNKRPMLSDLRESGSIEQDADQVLMLYRDEYYNAASEDNGVAEIIVAKNRGGPAGTVYLGFRAETTGFTNIDHGQSREGDKYVTVS